MAKARFRPMRSICKPFGPPAYAIESRDHIACDRSNEGP